MNEDTMILDWENEGGSLAIEPTPECIEPSNLAQMLSDWQTGHMTLIAAIPLFTYLVRSRLAYSFPHRWAEDASFFINNGLVSL